MDELISRQAAIDIVEFECGEWSGLARTIVKAIKQLPSAQPKGTKLSTVCLLCKKPAVTFNTEDDIPYTNYSYCEDCLRKGLKLLKAQNKMLPPVQPKQPKRGYWCGQFCSECGVSQYNWFTVVSKKSEPIGHWDFCPGCGAKMEER